MEQAREELRSAHPEIFCKQMSPEELSQFVFSRCYKGTRVANRFHWIELPALSFSAQSVMAEQRQGFASALVDLQDQRAERRMRKDLELLRGVFEEADADGDAGVDMRAL